MIYLEVLAAVLVAWVLLGVVTIAAYNGVKMLVRCRS